MKTRYFLFIGLFMIFISCDGIVYDIFTDSDIIINHENNPTDTIGTDTIHTDTITAEPFIFDTCQFYTPVSGSQFVCFWTNKDVIPVPPIQWMYNTEPIDDLETFLSQYGVVHLYISGINKGGTLKGNVTANQFQAKINCIDGIGQRFYLTFENKGLIGNGCMTFEQFSDELADKPNVKVITLFNTGYNCGEQNKMAEFLLADCKECDFTLWLNGSTCIYPEYIAEMKLRGATIIP